MSFSYNLTGESRKALAQTISEILGEPLVYHGVPTFTYTIDFYSVDRNGALHYPDNTNPEKVRSLVMSLMSVVTVPRKQWRALTLLQ